MEPDLHLRLAGVTRLRLAGRGPADAFVFDPHRLALPCWALARRAAGPALLLTLDRHLDLVAPPVPMPAGPAQVKELDELARWQLSVRNVDHVLSAMEAGLIGDALVVARARPSGSLEPGTWRDRHGRAHELRVVRSLDTVADGFGTDAASADAAWLSAALARHEELLLDVDLDCFTTPNDADPTSVLPWPLEQIRAFLRPHASEPLWRAALAKAVAVTVAREPYHCGGLVAGGRLFEAFAQAFFVELLGADLP